MNPHLAALGLCVGTRTPALIWGAPGTGKSSQVADLARRLGVPCEIVIASLRDPTDFGGLPLPQPDGTVALAPPAWARRLAAAGQGILFLDEISTAPPATQSALLRVVLDRVVGDLALPPGVAVVAAANPPEQAAGGWDLSPPLANRFIHLEPPCIDAGTWAESIVSGVWPSDELPPLPHTWEEDGRMRALIAGFLMARPALLLRVPSADSEQGRAWPSPRSWAMLARTLTAARAVQAPIDVQAVLATGAVGPGAAGELVGYLRNADLPDPEAMLHDPQAWHMPARGDLTYAVLSGVVDAALRRSTVERQVAAWEILATAAREGGADIGAIAARRLAGRTRPEAARRAADAIRAYLPVLKAAGLTPGQEESP
jgi:hypothetical protein